MTNELFFAIRYAGVVERIQRVEIAETTIGRLATNVQGNPHAAADLQLEKLAAAACRVHRLVGRLLGCGSISASSAKTLPFAD